MISQELKDKLVALSKEAQENAYVPYSLFPVGAALVTTDGDFFIGCNVENVCYGLGICGERTAVFKMISKKGPHAKIKAIAVTSKTDMPLTPCGACRQVILEFSTRETAIIYKGEETFEVHSIDYFLPGAFSKFVAVSEDDVSKFIQKDE